jgi:hypothetical protein
VPFLRAETPSIAITGRDSGAVAPCSENLPAPAVGGHVASKI